METNGSVPEAISYLLLRRLLGVLGLLFPLILWLGCWVLGEGSFLKASISMYYDSIMRNVFVGFLFAIGLFLFSYRGYKKIDNYAGNLACLFALGVAFLPTTNALLIVHYLHLICAVLFFATLACFSLFLFTRTDKDKTPSPEKRKRNKIYTGCGITIFVCLLLMALYFIIPSIQNSPISKSQPIFWLEAIALWAFGISWLIKGNVLLQDANNIPINTQSTLAEAR